MELTLFLLRYIPYCYQCSRSFTTCYLVSIETDPDIALTIHLLSSSTLTSHIEIFKLKSQSYLSRKEKWSQIRMKRKKILMGMKSWMLTRKMNGKEIVARRISLSTIDKRLQITLTVRCKTANEIMSRLSSQHAQKSTKKNLLNKDFNDYEYNPGMKI